MVFRKIWRGVKKVFKPVGKVIKKVGGYAESAVKKIGSTGGKLLDTGANLGKNAANLISPSNIVMYVGGFIAVVFLLPRILDSAAAKEAAKRIPVK
jgi:hypothetical protein